MSNIAVILSMLIRLLQFSLELQRARYSLWKCKKNEKKNVAVSKNAKQFFAFPEFQIFMKLNLYKYVPWNLGIPKIYILWYFIQMRALIFALSRPIWKTGWNCHPKKTGYKGNVIVMLHHWHLGDLKPALFEIESLTFQ